MCEPWEYGHETDNFPGAQESNLSEGSRAMTVKVGEGMAHLAWWMTGARTKGTAQ